jgi:hypothetical protein
MRARSEAAREPRRFAALALGLLLAAAPAAAGDEDPALSAWRERLAGARAELLGARERAERARDTYQDWRQRKVPRGVRKEALVRELEEAQAAAAGAEEAWSGLLEEARRAGVPPGVLRDYEE